MRIERQFYALALISLMACGGSLNESPTAPSVPANAVRVESRPFHVTYYSDFTERSRIVVRDATHWAAVWAEMYSGVRPLPPGTEPVSFVESSHVHHC